MTDTSPESDPLFTVTEACELLHIGRSKFFRLVREGSLTAINVNPAAKYKRVGDRGPKRILRVAQSEIDRFKKDNSVTA